MAYWLAIKRHITTFVLTLCLMCRIILVTHISEFKDTAQFHLGKLTFHCYQVPELMINYWYSQYCLLMVVDMLPEFSRTKLRVYTHCMSKVIGENRIEVSSYYICIQGLVYNVYLLERGMPSWDLKVFMVRRWWISKHTFYRVTDVGLKIKCLLYNIVICNWWCNLQQFTIIILSARGRQ